MADKQKIEICSISSRSRVLAHRPCPKLEMFCPSVLQLFYGCSNVLMTNHGMSFFVFVFLFFKPTGDPSSATPVPDLANQVRPFKSTLFKRPAGESSWLTRRPLPQNATVMIIYRKGKMIGKRWRLCMRQISKFCRIDL